MRAAAHKTAARRTHDGNRRITEESYYDVAFNEERVSRISVVSVSSTCMQPSDPRTSPQKPMRETFFPLYTMGAEVSVHLATCLNHRPENQPSVAELLAVDAVRRRINKFFSLVQQAELAKKIIAQAKEQAMEEQAMEAREVEERYMRMEAEEELGRELMARLQRVARFQRLKEEREERALAEEERRAVEKRAAEEVALLARRERDRRAAEIMQAAARHARQREAARRRGAIAAKWMKEELKSRAEAALLARKEDEDRRQQAAAREAAAAMVLRRVKGGSVGSSPPGGAVVLQEPTVEPPPMLCSPTRRAIDVHQRSLRWSSTSGAQNMLQSSTSGYLGIYDFQSDIFANLKAARLAEEQKKMWKSGTEDQK